MICWRVGTSVCHRANDNGLVAEIWNYVLLFALYDVDRDDDNNGIDRKPYEDKK